VVLGSLSSIITAPRVLDSELIKELVKDEENVVEELANRMEGIMNDDI